MEVWASLVGRSGLPTVVLFLANIGLCVAFARDLLDIANMALQNSPSSTRFITNKMCPFAQKAWIALECAKIPYELEEISLYGAGGKPDWFMKLNKKGTVPVVVRNGGAVVLPDSDLILDAIETGTIPSNSQLLLSDEGRQQDVKAWRRRINGMLPAAKRAVQGGGRPSMEKILADLEPHVIGPFLTGEDLTTADCHAFPFLWRINEEFGLDDYPNLTSWMATCAGQDGFRRTIQTSWWWWW